MDTTQASSPLISKSSADGQAITHQKSIKSGKNTERLTLDKLDPAYNVAAKTIKPGFRLSSFVDRFTNVQVKTGDATFSLNIRSTAKRLGVTPSEVKQIAKQGNALEVLQQTAQIRKQSLAKYETIAQNYVSKKGKLQNGVLSTNLTPQTLLKVIQKGMTIEGASVTIKEQKISMGKHTFVITSGATKIHYIQKQLGSGSFGMVFQTVELVSAQAKAMKQSKGDGNDKESAIEALKDLKNEHTALSILNPSGDVAGLPKPPSEVTVLSENGIVTGYMDMELMSHDIATGDTFMPAFQQLPAGERLNLCLDLLKGLRHMHSKEMHYVHGDIKPQNCLAKNDADGKPIKLTLSDFGSADRSVAKTYTKAYRPSDFDRSHDGAKEADVFALCKTLVELLGCTDYVFKTPPEPIHDVHSGIGLEIVNHLATSCGIPKTIAQILVGGMAPFERRPSASDLLAAFTTYVGNMTDEEKAAISKFGQIADLIKSF